MPNNNGESEPAPQPLVDAEVYDRLINDPYILHVTRHIFDHPVRDDPDYEDVDWRDEMLSHARSKYGVSDLLARAALIKCENMVLEEKGIIRSVEA